MTSKEKHEHLWEALAAFQQELPVIEKDQKANVKTKSGPSFSYEYADLATVSQAILPLLGKHGIAWVCKTLPDDTGAFFLHYKLVHESGESTNGIYPLPPLNTPPQAMGSAITYARRYSLLTITGVAPGGEDDDGAAAQQTPPQSRQAPPERQNKPKEQAPSNHPPQLQAETWKTLQRLAIDLKYDANRTLQLAQFLNWDGNVLREIDQGTADAMIDFMLTKLEEQEGKKA